MSKVHYILREVKWAEGRKKSEVSKYTWWSSTKDCSKLGGFSVTNNAKYEGSEVDGSVKVTAHTRDGHSFWKNFDIPLDKVEEFCHALIQVRDFALKHPKPYEK